MVSVLTDVVVLSSMEKLPPGYCLVDPLVVLKSGESRYLAYKKQLQSPGVLAVTDIAVGKVTSLVPPGYKTLTYTTPDNIEAFPDKILMIRKEGWNSKAEGIPHAITDIMILHKSKRDEMPCGYRMIHEICGSHICFKRNNSKWYDGVYNSGDEVFEEEDTVGSEDDDFYEIPSSSMKAKEVKQTKAVNGQDAISLCKKRQAMMAIKSIPSDGSSDDIILYPQESNSIRLRPLYSNVDMLIESGGYPLDQFLTPPPSSVLCAKCQKVLKNPYLLSCCESYLCEDCLLYIQQSSDKRCPSCEESDYNFGSSVSLKEKVEELLVCCINREKSCKWEGQLKDLDIHLLIYCPYMEIGCENKCGSRFLRCDLSQHQCPVQPQEPAIVNGTSPSSTVKELSHRIVRIEKKQEEEMTVLKQELRKYHSTKELGGAENNYLKLSFEVRGLKRQLAESVQRERSLEVKVQQQDAEIKILRETQNVFRQQFDSLVDQLELRSAQNTLLLPITPTVSPTSLRQPPCEFVVEQFSRYLKTPDSEWFSDPFLSDIQGYKFCLEVVPNGMLSSAGSDVSICVKLMRGDFDDQLKWPFQGKITVQILNWLCDQRHATRVIEFNADARRYGACGRVPVGCVGERASKGWGILPFLPHSYLPYNKDRKTEFIRNDCVCIRVASVVLT